jgi:ATP-dependent Clp protease ATP-binding subunit ClpA
MKGLIEEIKSLGNIILTIDEVHSIVGAGDAEGSMNAANILKPALSRGEIQVIGATTLTEYRKYIEKDAALERRFQPITVEEPSIADTVEILTGIASYYEEFHGIRIPRELLLRTAVLSERYITDRFLPDKAIDLLDEACASVVLNNSVLEDYAKTAHALTDLEHAAALLETPKDDEDEAAQEQRYRELADLKVQKLRKKDALDRLQPQKDAVVLTLEDVAHVIEVWTGVPAASITEDEFSKIDSLEANLKSRIIGQDYAVEAVSRAMKRSRAGISYQKRPTSFLFAGPTGVGKTELVKQLSQNLFSSPETLIRLDMSEFMEKHSVSKIIGAPPGYVGYDDAGQLTEKIRRKPYSVVLFDEIEKAHPDVLNILLQILDDGRVTDSQGRKVNFENTVIVMTTNAGSQGAVGALGFAEQNGDNDRTMKALSEFLRPEFINRIDEIITFRSLSQADFSRIAKIMLDELKSVLNEREIDFTYTDRTADYVAQKSYSVKYGARHMRRFIQKELEDPIANQLISAYASPIRKIKVDCDSKKEGLKFTYSA